VCTPIDSKEKSFTMILDFLYMHVGHNKAKVNTPIMAKGIIYYYKNYVHKKKKHHMLPIFVIMWLTDYLWVRLGREK
jgi:hypothetical protein